MQGRVGYRRDATEMVSKVAGSLITWWVSAAGNVKATAKVK